MGIISLLRDNEIVGDDSILRLLDRYRSAILMRCTRRLVADRRGTGCRAQQAESAESVEQILMLQSYHRGNLTLDGISNSFRA